ncbi:hypothetical protein SRHO_G00198830 [Serrasalmus rhombeus]
MLPALCSLFTALSCVSGVTVVTQKPPVLTPTKGETTTMHCNLGTVTNSAAYWYKQVPGEAPQHPIPALSPLSAPQAAHLLTQHRESSHTDKMLPALCSLFTALSCVSGVTVVTQKPPVLTPTKGETTTMHCNLGTVTGSAARWYKLVAGEAPHVIISNVEVGDSAVYYCSTWDDSATAHLFTQHRESSHTDKMLPALCSLFTALSCVSGVTVVTQKPPVLTPTKGETTTMHCNLGTVTNYQAVWYKQVPGEAPQYVLANYHGWSSTYYGSGFSSPKFTSTHLSQSDYTLIISNVEVGDSAVYYCKTWDSSASEYVSQ